MDNYASFELLSEEVNSTFEKSNYSNTNYGVNNNYATKYSNYSSDYLSSNNSYSTNLENNISGLFPKSLSYSTTILRDDDDENASTTSDSIEISSEDSTDGMNYG